MSLSDGKTRKRVNAARGQTFCAHTERELSSGEGPAAAAWRRHWSAMGRKLGFDMQNLGWEVTGGTLGGDSVSQAEGDVFWNGRCPHRQASSRENSGRTMGTLWAQPGLASLSGTSHVFVSILQQGWQEFCHLGLPKAKVSTTDRSLQGNLAFAYPSRCWREHFVQIVAT